MLETTFTTKYFLQYVLSPVVIRLRLVIRVNLDIVIIEDQVSSVKRLILIIGDSLIYKRPVPVTCSMIIKVNTGNIVFLESDILKGRDRLVNRVCCLLWL